MFSLWCRRRTIIGSPWNLSVNRFLNNIFKNILKIFFLYKEPLVEWKDSVDVKSSFRSQLNMTFMFKEYLSLFYPAGWCLCYAHRLVTGVYPIVLFVQNWVGVSEWPDNEVVSDSWISEKWVWMWSVGAWGSVFITNLFPYALESFIIDRLLIYLCMWPRWVWLRELVKIEFNICGTRTINHSQIHWVKICRCWRSIVLSGTMFSSYKNLCNVFICLSVTIKKKLPIWQLHYYIFSIWLWGNHWRMVIKTVTKLITKWSE